MTDKELRKEFIRITGFPILCINPSKEDIERLGWKVHNFMFDYAQSIREQKRENEYNND